MKQIHRAISGVMTLAMRSQRMQMHWQWLICAENSTLLWVGNRMTLSYRLVKVFQIINFELLSLPELSSSTEFFFGKRSHHSHNHQVFTNLDHG